MVGSPFAVPLFRASEPCLPLAARALGRDGAAYSGAAHPGPVYEW